VVFGNDPTQLNTLAVDTAFIPLFALQPELGRLIAPEEIGAHAAVMMISDVLWRTRFGAVPDVVGRFVDLAGIHYRIVGVMPEGFRFPYQTDAIVPLVERADSGTTTRDTYVALIGKLRRGVTRSAARTEMSVLAHHLGAIDAKEYAGATIEVRDEMLDRQARNFLPAPTLFLGAGMFLLLIACANVGNLFYVRTAERRTEMAIRASLGAGSGRLLRQALTETAMLSAIASVLGVTFAEVLVRVWLHVIPTQGFPSWFHLGLDWHILAFAIVVTSVVTMAAGLAPAREGTRFDLVRTLKGSDAGASSPNVSRGSKRGVVLQLALSMTLFVASALLVRSYRHLTKMDVGYPASSIATVDPLYDAVRYPQQSLRTDFADRILERAATMPGVTHAAVRGRFFGLRNDPASHVKRSAPSMERYDTHLIPDADSSRRVDPGRNHAEYVVSDDYFNVMGLHLRAGRAFTAADVAGAPTAVVVSARAASLLWGNRPAVGHTVQIGRFGDPLNVVGVVDNVRPLRGGWDGFHSDAEATFYLSERQALSMYPNILARAKSNAAPVHEEIANLVRRADPKLILLRDVTLANDLDEAHLITRVFGGIITALALSALLLSMIGIYGVVAFGVEQRRREIGVRIALGGTVRDVTRLIMGEAARLVGLGLVVGLVLATGAARLLKSFLFEVSAIDPMAYAATAVLFGGIALLASWLPALRVARVDPVAALRSE
jgi:putative ABC transport system permease protein